MSLRADNYTQLKKAPDLFSDFLDDFSPHPLTGDIGRIRNDQSIKQALRNLVLTNYGERLFQPQIGSNTTRTLFEPNDYVAENNLKYSISKTIEASEPRVALSDVTVVSSPDQSSVSINIVFSIINTGSTQSLDLILRRVR